MGFEAPLALFGLLAVGLPVAIHLMRRRDLPRIVLPTIALLRRAQAQSRRRFELMDLLLMLLRVLVVALAAFALAAPFFLRSVAFGNGTPMSLAIVLDDSMSMTRRVGGHVILDDAIARADDIVASLARGSEVSIVLAGSPIRTLIHASTDHAAARRALRNLPRESGRSTDMPAAAAVAVSDVATGRFERRSIVVLSDGAEHGHIADVHWPTDGIDVLVEPMLDKADTANRAVVSVDASADPTSPGTASVSVEIRGSTSSAEPLELVIADRVVSRATFAVTAGVARGDLRAPLTADATVAATVRLARPDALPADDGRAVLLHVARGVTCLIVNGQPDRVAREDELRFLTRALQNQPDDQPDIRIRNVDPDALSARDVADADVVWLMDVASPGAALATTLTDYVQRGGGLVISLGPRTDPVTYRTRLGGLLPATPGEAAVETPPISFAPSTAAPLFADGLMGSEVRRRVLLDDWNTGATPLLDYTDGSPALLLRRVGEGSAVLFTTTLDDGWNDLPYRPGYVPLISRLVTRLSKHTYAGDVPVVPGAPHRIAVPGRAARVVVTSPDGTTYDLPDNRPFTHTATPGVYRVAVETPSAALTDVGELAFVVAPDPRESDLRPARITDTGAAKAQPKTRSVIQQPAANWAFLALGILALAEGLARIARLRTRPPVTGQGAPSPATTASLR